MGLQEQTMRKIPDYYDTMYMDGFTPTEIVYAKHRQMMAAYAERMEQPIDVNIRTEVKTK